MNHPPVKPDEVRKLALLKEDENIRFRSFLKNCDLSVEELDSIVMKLAVDIGSQIDCTKCANCCKEIAIGLTHAEVARLAPKLNLPPEEFIARHLEPTEDKDADDPDWETRNKPCIFLKDNRCSVYEDRPAVCRDYPHLHKPDFVFRLWGMLERAETCPIVYEVLEALKPIVGFRIPRRR